MEIKEWYPQNVYGMEHNNNCSENQEQLGVSPCPRCCYNSFNSAIIQTSNNIAEWLMGECCSSNHVGYLKQRRYCNDCIALLRSK